MKKHIKLKLILAGLAGMTVFIDAVDADTFNNTVNNDQTLLAHDRRFLGSTFQYENYSMSGSKDDFDKTRQFLTEVTERFKAL